ncbi:helix-turn-helix domain-containing protein [Actinomadura sp. 21ATH]|uniref:helix-turn-helix domain-containing protein n=1 Tax=Actinomadura sp. 21ATH TaxID=1735444 RepID=UPI0035C25840
MSPANKAPAYAPSVRARRLARSLKEARLQASLTATQAAARLGWSQPKISHIENGRTKPGAADVEVMLHLYGVTSPQRDALLTLAREAERRGWWTDYTDVFTGSYVALEDEASLIREWQHQLVPGLLQTQDYAREVISAGRPDIGEDEVRRRVMARMARQTLLRREPNAPELHVVLDEAVLQRPIGGVELMRAQLRHLAEESRRPNVTTQILPRSVGTHAGLEGLFILLRFSGTDDPDVAYTEGIYGDVYLESSSQITRCNVAFEALCRSALTPDESLAMIKAAAEA